MRHFAEERIKSDLMVLEYEWRVGEWSKCSHSCGEKGIQLRTIECRVTVLNNATRHVPKGLCIDGGLPEPPTVRSCQLDPCPEWVTGEWSEQCTYFNSNSPFSAAPKLPVLEHRLSEEECHVRDGQQDDNPKPLRQQKASNQEKGSASTLTAKDCGRRVSGQSVPQHVEIKDFAVEECSVYGMAQKNRHHPVPAKVLHHTRRCHVVEFLPG
ncbi:protein madd-4, partial [Caerostris extrusa]